MKPIGNWVWRFEGQCFTGEPNLNDEICARVRVLQKHDLEFLYA